MVGGGRMKCHRQIPVIRKTYRGVVDAGHGTHIAARSLPHRRRPSRGRRKLRVRSREERVDRVAGDHWVGSEDRQAEQLGLGDEQAVEWIAVQAR
jgi:hypothetical protein